MTRLLSPCVQWIVAIALSLGIVTSPCKASADQIAEAGWIRVLGWNRAGDWVAFRTGRIGQGNVPGAPCQLAKLDATGAVVQVQSVPTEVTAALIARKVHSVPTTEREVVTTSDVLLRTRTKQLLAVIARGQSIGILLKRQGEYHPVWEHRLAKPAVAVQAFAYENPGSSAVAVVVEAHAAAGPVRPIQSFLVVVPLSDDATAGTAKANSSTARP